MNSLSQMYLLYIKPMLYVDIIFAYIIYIHTDMFFLWLLYICMYIYTSILYMYVYIYLREIFDFFLSKVKMLSVGCLRFYSLGVSFHWGFYVVDWVPLRCWSSMPGTDWNTASSLSLPAPRGPVQGSARSALLLPSALMRSLCRPAICLKLPS